MGKTSGQDENRSLIHILIGREKDDPDVELRAITSGLARLIMARANGNKELIHAVLNTKVWQQLSSPKPKPRARHPQKPRGSRSPTKRNNPRLLRAQKRPKEKKKKKAKAKGQAVTPEDVMQRAKELLP